MNSTIIAEQLSKTYIDAEKSIAVLNNLNLCVVEGEVVAIIGASGSGKTTLLQLLGGLDHPTSGVVSIGGQNLALISEVKRSEMRNNYLGFVYQFHHLLPEFNAWENVAMPLLIRGVSRVLAKQKAIDLLQRVKLGQRLDHRVGELSGGERQRVAIVRALVTNPHCVLADEPTGNLDPTTADYIFNLLLELNNEYKTSFVIVTHNRELAKRCHRVLELSQGQLVETKQ